MLNSAPLHVKNIKFAGKSLADASKVLIMVHGRGGTAGDILSLANYLKVSDFALIAPEATNNTWYPYPFMAAPILNEPWLTSALALLKEILSDIMERGISPEDIFFLGFSQGACLALEFTARNAIRYGGIAAFTGGLIGDKIYMENYSGDFEGTPVFIGSSNPDPHIPVERVHASANIFKTMNAAVTQKLYNNMGHTISQDEIDIVNKFIFSV